jgi:PIN domain nuclease of toxin-antitoxin system
MKYLIDTHVLLWITENSSKLPDKIKNIVLDERNSIYVSIVSAWEIAIKLGTGKLKVEGGLPEIKRLSDENGFIMLSVDWEYIHLLRNMPVHHKDPFDRMLIATAVTEGMTLITIDENIHKYNLSVLW